MWYDNDRLFRQSLVDAPNNYRVYWLWSRHLRTLDRDDEATEALERAAALYSADPVVFEDLGQLQRAAGACDKAIVSLERALAIDTTRIIARSRLVYCLIEQGELTTARSVASIGVTLGGSSFLAPIERIDSLLAARAAP